MVKTTDARTVHADAAVQAFEYHGEPAELNGKKINLIVNNDMYSPDYGSTSTIAVEANQVDILADDVIAAGVTTDTATRKITIAGNKYRLGDIVSNDSTIYTFELINE